MLIGRESDRRERLRRQAVENFAMARDAVDHMLSRVGDVELAESPQMGSVRRRLSEEALHFTTASSASGPTTRISVSNSAAPGSGWPGFRNWSATH